MPDQQIRVVFISRKHPPSIGGMQRLSYHLVSEMRSRVHAIAVTWGGSQKALPFFLPYAFLRSLWEARRGIDLVCAGDPMVATVAWLLKAVLRVPVVAVAHGLDVTWRLPLYQFVIPPILRRLDRIVCISEAAQEACLERGIASERCVVINPGVSVPDSLPSRNFAREQLGKVVGRSLGDAKVLLTVGRLVQRKGVVWFLESVFSPLAAQFATVHYVVVGDGKDRDRAAAAVRALHLEDRVTLAGSIPEAELECAYVGADVFVMPNVTVAGDMEGFGLVALEAAAHGLPVLAADVEGIRAAVIPGQTGELVEAENQAAWLAALKRMLQDDQARLALSREAPRTVASLFGWACMADAYEAVFRQTIAGESAAPARTLQAGRQ